MFLCMRKSLVPILFFCLGLMACKPLSKEAYLEKYSEFISEVSANYKQYTSDDWAKQSEKFVKFSENWYVLYENELTSSEKLKIAEYEVRWRFCQGLYEMKTAIDSFDVEQFKEDASYYINNNMMHDLKDLYDSAVDLGEECGDAATEILEDLHREMELLQQN